MTEQSYSVPIETFDHGLKPEPWYEVQVLEQGADAIKRINENLGTAANGRLKHLILNIFFLL